MALLGKKSEPNRAGLGTPRRGLLLAKGQGAEIGQLQDLRRLNLLSKLVVRLALALKINHPASPRSRHVHFKRRRSSLAAVRPSPGNLVIQELRPLPVTSRLGERHKDGNRSRMVMLV